MNTLFRKLVRATLISAIAVMLLPTTVAMAAVVYYVDDDNCPGPGSGTQLDPYCTIQDAVDNAVDGATIYVAAGTYEDAVPIYIGGFNGLNLIAPDGPGVTTIQLPDSALNPGPIVTVEDSHSVLFQGFTVSGNDNFDLDTDGWMAGINYHNSSGTIQGNYVTGIDIASDAASPPSNYFGSAIAANDDDGVAVSKLNILDNEVDTFLNNGLDLGGYLKLAVSGNTITGGGVSSGYANQTGIWIGFGATGKIIGNVIYDVPDAPPSNPQGTGVDIYQTSKVKLKDNTIDTAAVGVRVGVECRDGMGVSSGNKIMGNTISNISPDGTGVEIGAHTFDNGGGDASTCDPLASGNKVQKNTFTNTGDGNATWVVGVRIGRNDDDGYGTGFVPYADGNQVKSNTFTGFDTAVEDQGSNTKTSSNVSNP